MANNNRQAFIQYAIDSKLNTNQINSALKEVGLDTLSKVETQRINDGNFGLSPMEYISKSFGEFSKGLSTIGGGVGEYIANPEFRAEVNKGIGNYIQEKGTSGAALDLANAMLQPYNDLSVQKLLTQSPGETLSDIGSGIVAHPINAALDLAGIGGVGLDILQGTTRGSRLLSKVPNLVEKAKVPNAVKSMVKGTRQHEINNILNTAKVAPVAAMEELDNLNFTIKAANNADVAQAIKNLETGIWEGTEAQLNTTRTLKDLATRIDNLMVKAGFNPTQSRVSATSQYITRSLQNEGKNIPVAEIEKYLNSPKHKIEGVDDVTLSKLKAEGERLYDEGRIFPIRHTTTGTTAREGLVDEATKKVRGKNEKLYGTQSYEDLAEGLRKSGYDNTLEKLLASERTLGALDEINNSLGRKVTNLDELKLADNEVLVSPTLLREKFGTALATGSNIQDDIRSLSRGLNKAEQQKYADDLYVYNKDDLKALERAFTKEQNPSYISQAANSPLTGLYKRSALSSPRYTIGNITTNVGMNLTEGVTPLDYIKAGMLKDKLPKSLKQSTTFTGYLGGDLKANTSLSEIYKQLAKRFEEGNLGQKLEALSEMMTDPLFRISGNAEMFDRGANFIKQAERYAKENNVTFEWVLKEARKKGGNNDINRLLMQRVNNSLGDYTGRNYYLPRSVTDLGSFFTPFMRPYTQAFRMFAHHTTQNPLQNYVFNRLPARYGSEVSDRAQEELNVSPNQQYGGGFPILPAYGKMPSRVLTNTYHAYNPIGELALSPSEAFGGNLFPLTPFLGMAGLNRYGSEPSLPNQITINGRKVQLDNNGNVMDNKLLTNTKLALAQSAQAYYAPINIMNTTILPTIAGLTGQEYRRPVDTAILGTIGNMRIPGIMESDPTSRARVGLQETFLPMWGFNYSDTYPKREVTMREITRGLRSQAKRGQRNERRAY